MSFLTEFFNKTKSNFSTVRNENLNSFLTKRKFDRNLHEVGFYDKSVNIYWKNYPEDFQKFCFYGKNIDQCLIFPYFDYKDNLIGIETRKITEKFHRKYTSDKDFPLFYGLNLKNLQLIYSKKCVFLVEGIFDYNFVKQILPNTLSTVTAAISNSQINFLKRWVDTVTLIFDSDKKGAEASNFFIDKFVKNSIKCNCIFLPEKDPADFFEKNSFEYCKYILTNKINEVLPNGY